MQTERPVAVGYDVAHQKLQKLKTNLGALGSVAVAFSGGVDSTFLLKVAHDVLGDRVLAVTATSETFPAREAREAAAFCEAQGIRHLCFESGELNIPGYRENPVDRCYHCKHSLFKDMLRIAEANNLAAVAEGSNTDDNGDYRPGLRAVSELGIKSPLRQVGLAKSEIRALSKEMGLPTWRKQSYACLASRFVYGEPITEEKLRMVDMAEEFLLNKGFCQLRVRIHGNLARIEVLPEEMERVFACREEITDALKSYGFQYVSLDLQGYRTGSMNEVLSEEEKR
ncbi:MAG: ATP-dependent sacrificial sulfur transferase LarE [Clostridia bacterium]|nr:ATP-dependent sacrificial sulfur transferase LarE [Clostridia bacterium]